MTADADSETPYDRTAAPTVAGKHVIIVLFGLGLLSVVLSLGYHWNLQRRPIEYWGSNNARLFLHATETTARQLATDEERDLEGTPGFTHIRQALINDVSFAWDQPPPAQPPAWQYSLTFRDQAGESVEVLFDVAQGYTALATRPEQPISISPVVKEFAAFFRARFE